MCHAPGMRIDLWVCSRMDKNGDAQTAPNFEHVHGENEDKPLDFGVSCSFGGYNSLLLKHDGTGALVTFLALESPDGLGSIYTHETCVKVEALLSEESKDLP